jgi:hypothetical protein
LSCLSNKDASAISSSVLVVASSATSLLIVLRFVLNAVSVCCFASS